MMIPNEEHKIIGAIYPLKKTNFDMLKKRRKPAYIKFLTHTNSRKPTKLHRGHFLLFYLSGGKKSIVGYSKIKEVLFKTPLDIKQY